MKKPRDQSKILASNAKSAVELAYFTHLFLHQRLRDRSTRTRYLFWRKSMGLLHITNLLLISLIVACPQKSFEDGLESTN